MKVVAFLDLLGFSNAVTRDAEEALSMLHSYNTIIQIAVSDLQRHPSCSYSPELQTLAKRTSTESFDDFIPFSDSIFVTSNNCSDFIMQLGSFIEKSFHFTAHIYESPQNQQDPTAYHNIGVVQNGKGELMTVNEPCHIPPVLFRGGVALGEVNIITLSCILNKERKECHTLLGDAVVEAVRLEQKKVKGPRIVFGQEVFNELDDKTRLYCRNLPEDINYYELLWPGMKYILENHSNFQTEFCHFYDLFTPAYNLWFPFKNDTDVRVHYERFIELIVYSAIRIYDRMGMKDFALQQIKKAIDGKFDDDELKRIFSSIDVLWKN